MTKMVHEFYITQHGVSSLTRCYGVYMGDVSDDGYFLEHTVLTYNRYFKTEQEAKNFIKSCEIAGKLDTRDWT